MTRSTLAGSAAALVLCAGASAQFIGPTPYLSAADSPFMGFAGHVVEDFEDGVLNAPGISALDGLVTDPGVFTDSVDGDDGNVDGFGQLGRSLYSRNAISQFRFNFDAAAIGAFPTHAGVVWTDVGNVLTGGTGFGNVYFEAFDAGGVSLGVSGPFLLGDGNAVGGTAEDRFFGFVNAAGISSILISMDNSVDWEVDHVQYAVVPGPGTAGLLVMGGVPAARRRRR
jgi:hypothetical protein